MELRRISTSEQKDAEDSRKKRRNKYLGISLLFIMAISSIGYAFISSNPDNSSSDKKSEGIYEQDGKWIFKQGQLQLMFNTNPEEAKNISSNMNLSLNDYSQKKLYIVDEQQVLFGYLMQSVGKYVQTSEACLGNCELDLPERNCSDYVVVWNRNGSNALRQEGNCVFIDGDLKAVDAYVYRAFKLI